MWNIKIRNMESKQDYSAVADNKAIERTIEALSQNGITAVAVDTGREAAEKALSMLPDGAEVMTMSSVTLAELGLDREIAENPRFSSVKNKLSDPGSTLSEMGKKRLGTAHEWALGSVHAVTENGQLLIASATGSQLPAYAYGASKVIWLIGAQKLVKNIDLGFERIYEYCFPLEDERFLKAYGLRSGVNKILVISKEVAPERLYAIIIRKKIGF